MNKTDPEWHRQRAKDYLAGRQYGRKPASFDHALTEVGPSTPMGELMRRYWQPFALSSEITQDLPVPIRLLGEDLVAFRDGTGNVGLMYPRCMHRGASLVLGKVEPEGLRCPYHGWKFDTRGHLLDTPCELNPTSTALHRVVRQPWYPVVERYGIAFTYMGPPDKEPQFPIIPLLDEIGDDEVVLATGGSVPEATMPMALMDGQMDMNWLQNYENVVDPLHLNALHRDMNGVQFTKDISRNPESVRFRTFADGSVAWIGKWETAETGHRITAVFQTALPNIHIAGPVFKGGHPQVSWVLPRDDHSYRAFMLRIVKKDGPQEYPPLAFFDSESWGPKRGEAYTSWSLEDRQRWQTDYLVQKSQGLITLHSEEKLTRADTGVVMLRRVLEEQMKLVAAGHDPIGATPGEAWVVTQLGSTARHSLDTGELVDGYLLKTFEDFA